jgi:hypothetical protein
VIHTGSPARCAKESFDIPSVKYLAFLHFFRVTWLPHEAFMRKTLIVFPSLHAVKEYKDHLEVTVEALREPFEFISLGDILPKPAAMTIGCRVHCERISKPCISTGNQLPG